MSTRARRRLIQLLALAGVIAPAGIAVVATSGGNGTTQASALAGDVNLAPPTVTAVPAPHATSARAAAAAAAKPPPVVDGVRRSNVGAAHSPRLTHALSGGPAKPAGAPPASAGSRGIDVASYQHPNGALINWAQVARAGYKFTFIKASEGGYYGNPYYATDLARARAAGLNATGYHFAVPNVSGGARQARYAVRHVRRPGRNMPLALDIEYNPYGSECYGLTAAHMVAWLSAFTAEARRLTGQRPIIYTTADWWRSCTGNSKAFGSDPLWVAAYGSSAPPMPAGWRSWTFWQYTSSGRVPGISGNVDLSYYGRPGMTGRASAPPAPRAGSPRPKSSPRANRSPGPKRSPRPSPGSPAPTPSSPQPTASGPASSPGTPAPPPSGPASSPGSPAPSPTSASPTPSPGTASSSPGSAAPASPAPGDPAP